MALTLKVQQQLERVELTKFFSETKSTWQTFAQRAYKFVEQNYPKGATIRHDDVAQALLPVVNVDESLTNVLAEKKLTQKYWRADFCDFVLDRCWNQIKG